MTSGAGPWQFEYQRSQTLPALAWLARIQGYVVSVQCGLSVRIGEHGFFEGTWAGPAHLESVAEQETTFGSGIVVSGGELVVVPPAHTLEPVYHARDRDGSLVVSNSLVALLVATGNQLRSDVLYPPIFGLINRGLSYASADVPTSGEAVTVHYFENLRIEHDGRVSVRLKPRGTPFTNFTEYRDGLTDRVRSSFANAPDYRPTVAMSTGYDSTAAGAIAAQGGCDSVVSFRTGWPWAGYDGEEDSPDVSARALGMSVELFERLAYMDCNDAPEAEFLATGMSGEDVVYRSMDTALSRRILVTGFWGGAAWRGNARPNLSRIDLSGASLGEFRMRVDMIHLPLPYINGVHQPNLAALRMSAEPPAVLRGRRVRRAFRPANRRGSRGTTRLVWQAEACHQPAPAHVRPRCDVEVCPQLVRELCRFRGDRQPATKARCPRTTSPGNQGRARRARRSPGGRAGGDKAALGASRAGSWLAAPALGRRGAAAPLRRARGVGQLVIRLLMSAPKASACGPNAASSLSTGRPFGRTGVRLASTT